MSTAASGARDLVDAHNHLHDAWLTPHRDRVLADVRVARIRRMVVNGTSEQDWPEVAQLASAHDFVVPSFGLHPWYVGNASPHWRETLLARLDAAPAAGMGEIGLDRWILERAKPDDARLAGLRRASLAEQLDAFQWQLGVAASRNLPATIHCLECWGQLHEALRNQARPARGFLLHAYGGSAELASELAALGAYFSFNGYFLQARQQAKRAVFAALPADRLLVETDAPAMSLPADRRTHELPALADGNAINHPANLAAIYTGLAEIRGCSVDALTDTVSENFTRLFGR